MQEGATRPFVSWEQQSGAKWHEDEDAVRAEMELLFPDDGLYKRQLPNESFYDGQKRKVKIIQAWEKMRDQLELGEINEREAKDAEIVA